MTMSMTMRMRRDSMWKRSARWTAYQICLGAIVGWIAHPARAQAQTPATGALTLNDAVQLALKNYPAIKESRARAQAAAEGVGVARTAYLPRLDGIWQV